MNTSIIEKPPLWGVGLFTLALVLISIRIGQAAGLARTRKGAGEAEGPVGSIVAAVLGLLAFMLAFIVRLCLAVAFSWVVLLIATLDRPTAGMITVSQQPMIELKKKLDSRP